MAVNKHLPSSICHHTSNEMLIHLIVSGVVIGSIPHGGPLVISHSSQSIKSFPVYDGAYKRYLAVNQKE